MRFVADYQSKLDVPDLLHRPQKHLIADDHYWVNRAVDKLLKT